MFISEHQKIKKIQQKNKKTNVFINEHTKTSIYNDLSLLFLLSISMANLILSISSSTFSK